MKRNFASSSVVALAVIALTGAVAAQTPAQTQPQDSAANPAVKKVSVKGTARFDFDKAAVNTEDGTKLMTEVRSMKNVTWQTINVTGHTDSVGSDGYNQKLSERRAEAVQAFLIDKGVKPERIKTGGRGEASPIANNNTADGRAQNRRTEIEFQGLQSVAP
ncbi:MAG TPA: OmpA family protein [Casimicrobiaceae bacterium]|nr:OmpA family protein [Casimicrobiaceae bacterium]